MNLLLKKGEKVRVIDDMAFPDEIKVGHVGWVLGRGTGHTTIRFYPSKKTVELDNHEIGCYVERIVS